MSIFFKREQLAALLIFFAAAEAENTGARLVKATTAVAEHENVLESGEEFFVDAHSNPTSDPDNDNTSSGGRRRQGSGEKFTIAFVSDVEAGYRGHKDSHARRIVEFIRDIGSKNLKFNNYNVKVDPELVVHGGDINIDSWACGAPGNWFTCRTPSTEMRDVWRPLYDAGIPTISNWGNHDWMADGHGGASNSLVDEANRKSMEFAKKSFEKAAQVSSDFEFTRFATDFDIGPETYKATFKGFQIGMFMNTALEKGYDTDVRTRHPSWSTANALKDSLDTSKPAMFVSHVPLVAQDADSKDFVTNMIREFPSGSHHFSGHAHKRQDINMGDFTDYVAPYPQWYGYDSDPMPKPITEAWKARKRTRGEAPGFFAILVDSVQGILEVKEINLEGKDPLKAGDRCFNCAYDCPDNSNNYEWWHGKFGWACGAEPCWGKSTGCYGTACGQCCNGARQPWYWGGYGECK